MTPCNETIRKLNKVLPELCTVNDLIRVGIISHRNSMEYYRRKKMGPPYIRLSERRIFYPKPGIMKWLEENSYDCQEAIEDSGKVARLQSEPELA